LFSGEWVKHLGLGESEKYVGRPDSIAIRIPDSTITCHLIDQCGPIAVTPANPTGEGDTTHHFQVLAKLGIDKVFSNVYYKTKYHQLSCIICFTIDHAWP
jgi:tRNA A37 threonylcarbamoyladenosine synthetase subunit TsaC/SUA5/YrdC